MTAVSRISVDTAPTGRSRRALAESQSSRQPGWDGATASQAARYAIAKTGLRIHPHHMPDATNPCWQTLLLDSLEALDRRERPHGLYGLRQAHAVQDRLPTLAHLLSCSGPTYVMRGISVGAKLRSAFGSEQLDFVTEAGEQVSLRVLDCATTKVRNYGSSFRLDEHHGKKSKEPQWDLESLVPKLAKHRGRTSTFGLMLIAHVASPKELECVFGRSTTPDFVKRYELTHHSREWEDRYGRAFQTSIQLWCAFPSHVG